MGLSTMFSGTRSFLRSVLLALALAAPAAAQTISIGNGAAATPSLRYNGSLTTGLFRFGPDSVGLTANATAIGYFHSRGFDFLSGKHLLFAANDTIHGAPIWTSLQTFATGQLVDSATGAARAQVLTTARTIGGVSFNGSANIIPDTVLASARSQILTTSRNLWGVPFNGSANVTGDPTFTNITISGTCTGCPSGGATVSDTVRQVTFDSVRATRLIPIDSIRFNGTTSSIRGGTGNMTIQSGTGNSRTMALRVTTSTGTPIDVFSGNTSVDKPQVVLANGRLQIYDMVPNTGTYTTDFSTILGMPSGTTCGTTNGVVGKTDTRTSGLCFTGTATGVQVQSITTLTIDKGVGPGAATISGGAGSMNIIAGTGNSRTMTLQTTTSAGAAKNTLVLGADSSATFLGKVKVQDGVAMGLMNASENNRIYFAEGADTIGVILNSSLKQRINSSYIEFHDELRFSTGGTVTSPAVSLQPNLTGSQSGMYLGTNLDSLGFSEDGVAFAYGISDTLVAFGKMKAGALTAASGTPNSVCIDATTKQILENAATSCVVSSRRYKKNIRPLTYALAAGIVDSLAPKTFQYRANNRTAFGLIAEDVYGVSDRLVTRDSIGPNSVNYEQVTILLLRVVQEQQARFAKMCKAGIKEAC